ncbi:MAG: hypothetical protein FJ206_10135 [Gemmatimonadetes bacterium]|nr:hypothetical protein [Gemmatimonadota bacterium]
MEFVEKLARGVFMVLAIALFGWVIALLAIESAWRRWREGSKRREDGVYAARPGLRPTTEFRTRRMASW